MLTVLKALHQHLIIRLAFYLTVVVLILGGHLTFKTHQVVEEIRSKKALLHARQNIQLNFEEVLELYTRQYNKVHGELEEMRPEKTSIIEVVEKIESLSLEKEIEMKIKNIEVDSESFIRYNVVFEGSAEQLEFFMNLLNTEVPFHEIRGIAAKAVNNFTLALRSTYNITFDIFTK